MMFRMRCGSCKRGKSNREVLAVGRLNLCAKPAMCFPSINMLPTYDPMPRSPHLFPTPTCTYLPQDE